MGAFGCEDVGYTESVRDNKFTTTTAARLCVRDLQGAQSSANRQKRQRQINECVFLPLLFHLIPPRPPIFLPSLIIVIIIPLTRFVWLYQTTWGAEKNTRKKKSSSLSFSIYISPSSTRPYYFLNSPSRNEKRARPCRTPTTERERVGERAEVTQQRLPFILIGQPNF